MVYEKVRGLFCRDWETLDMPKAKYVEGGIDEVLEYFRNTQAIDPNLKVKRNNGGFQVKYGKAIKRTVAELYDEAQNVFHPFGMKKANVLLQDTAPSWFENIVDEYASQYSN